MGENLYRAVIVTCATLSVTLCSAVLFSTSRDATAPYSSPDTSPSPAKEATTEDASSELRRIVDASVAKLGSTGWVQENPKTGKRVFFDPLGINGGKIAARDSKTSKPYLQGSMFEVVPFELMGLLERTPEDIKVTKDGEVFTVAYRDVMAKGSAFFEYQVQSGVIVSKTIRDRVGQKNELNVLIVCRYGLDETAKADLLYANNNPQVGGHD